MSPLDPFLGIQSAMTSVPLSPESKPQAQSLLDTLDSFTAAGAYTEFAETKKGKLMPGMLADVIILNGNIEATPAAQMSTLKPVLTICDGRITFEEVEPSSSDESPSPIPRTGEGGTPDFSRRPASDAGPRSREDG